MAFTDMAFTPVDGFRNTTSYPNPGAGAARDQVQDGLDQIRDYINDTLIGELAAVTNGASGADNIGMTAITETGINATVQSVIEALITRLKAVTDSASGADLIGMTVITETGANATVQAVIEALITRLKAVTDSTSGADLIGATAIDGLTGGTVQALLEALDTALDTHLADTTPHSGATPEFNGIVFPATQVPSAGANTLDDYEEGTFTAELRGQTTRATTPVEVTGYYTKIGRQVTCIMFFNNVDTTGASGSLQVAGLPFTSNGTTGMRGSNAVTVYGLDVPGLYLTADVPPNNSTVYLFANKDEAAWAVTDIIAGAGKYIGLTVTYFV